jgi:hypothetical protein
MVRLNPLGSSSFGDGSNPGVYLGEVTRIVDGIPYVEIPRLAVGYEYPARSSITYVPEAGHDVAVGFLEGGDEELVILLRLG